MTRDFNQSLGPSFLPHILMRLANRFIQECEVAAHEFGLVVPQRLESTVHFLHREGTRSVMDIAGAIGQSHPFVIKGVKELKELGLVHVRSDAKDRRRTLVKLTPKGETQARHLVETLPFFEAAYHGLMREANAEIFDSLWRLEEALNKTAFAERIAVERARAMIVLSAD